jgi:parallel beta-helix repeat protein
MRPFSLMLVLLFFATSGLYAANCGETVPCQCGDTVVRNYVLPADLGPCKGHGLRIASGVVLDGNGYRLMGSLSTSESYGIYLDGTIAATVKNVRISGFRRGIRLRRARNNQIRNNEAFRNGDFVRRVGYGIDVASGARSNLFEGNLIYNNADEGVHLGSGSAANTFMANTIYNNTRENIYLFTSHHNTLLYNTTWGGQNSLFIKDSSFTLIKGNTFSDSPVVIRADSHDNELIDNDIIGAGLHFQVYTKEFPFRFPRANMVRDGKITNTGSCLRFDSSWDNVILRTVFSSCGTDITSVSDRAQSRNAIVSASFKPNNVRLDAGSVIEVGWFVEVTVQDTTGQPLSGARVRVFDAAHTSLFDVLTDSNGKIGDRIVLEYVRTGSRLTSQTPIVVETTKSGYTPDRRQMFLSGDTAVTITLR